MEVIKSDTRLVMPATAVHVYEPSGQMLASYSPDEKKPRFCVTMQLARLDIANANGHRISLEEAKKAIEANDKPIPGNLDHVTAAYGASERLWIDDEGKLYPELMLSAVYWTRYISEEKLDEIMASYNNGKLGSSWEIDPPFELSADKDDSKVFDIIGFEFAGFGLMIGREPAESSTKGTAVITASLDGDMQVIHDQEMEIFAALESKALTYDERQKLPDSDFALIRYVKGQDDEKIKERHFPIDQENRRSVVLAFLQKSKQFSTEEKIKVFKKALARGKKEGDNWVAKYKGYNTDVFPPKPTTGSAATTYECECIKCGYKVTSDKHCNTFKCEKCGGTMRRANRPGPGQSGAAGATDIVQVSNYGDLPVDILQNIPCPVCGARGVLKRLDFENGVFELECRNAEYEGDQPTHRYEVSVNVKLKGQEQAYRLAASKEEYGEGVDPDDIEMVGDSIKIALKLIRKEVEGMAEYTDEQIAQIKKDAIEEALADAENDKKEAATKEADVEAQITKSVEERVEKAKADAVEAYKVQLVTVAERLDEYGAIVPFESEEAKESFKAELVDMSDADYAHRLELRKKDKEIAELKKGESGEDDKNEDESSEEEKASGGKLAAGKVDDDEEVVEDYKSLAAIATI